MPRRGLELHGNSRNASISTISRGRARCAAGDFCFPLRRRRSPSCGSRGMAFAATAACTPPEACPPRTRSSPSSAPPATCPPWVFTTKRSSTRSASRAMTAPCITPRKRSRPRALPATPIIGERFDLPPRATRIVRSVTRTSRRAGVPPVLSTTLAVLKAIIPNSPYCDRAPRPGNHSAQPLPPFAAESSRAEWQPRANGLRRLSPLGCRCRRSVALWRFKKPSGNSKRFTREWSKNESSISAPSRAYMAPATYAQTCAACHALQFDKRLADAVPHDKPEVIHPFVVAKLQAYIAAHPADLRVPRDPSRDLPEKPIPADYRLLTPPQWVAERTAEDEQLLWRKTCKQCHTLIADEGAALPKSRRRISPRATCRTQISITRSTASWTARAAMPPRQPASKVPTCFCPASRRAAPATMPAPKRRNRAASSATPTTIPPSANPRTAISPWRTWGHAH